MNRQLKTSVTKLLVLSAAFSAQPCSSDYTYGYTNNAAAGGNTWSMSSPVLGVAPVEGMDINGVIYRYTAVKNQADAYIVSIQNEAADGNGFIFRSTDDWSGKSGTTLTRFVPVPYSPLGRWGQGSIDEVGIGSVVDPVVVYTFRQSPVEPTLPDLPELPTITPYDALSDEAVSIATTEVDLELIQDDDQAEADKEKDEDKERLETALAASDNALTLSAGMTQAALLQAMNVATNLNTYYDRQISGGTYREAIVLQDKNLPDNRRAFRSLSKQKLHTEMIEEQYR